MKDHFFALDPSGDTLSFVQKCKETAAALAGKQLYLGDAPHLTLYVGRFRQGEALEKAVSREIIGFLPARLQLGGWHTFHDDPVTGGHTLVIDVAASSMKTLRELQMNLIAAARPFRYPGILPRYADHARYTAEMKESLDLHGFPFVGDIWRAHFTIASFAKGDYPRVWRELSRYRPPSEVLIEELSLNEILKTGFATLLKWRGKETSC